MYLMNWIHDTSRIGNRIRNRVVDTMSRCSADILLLPGRLMVQTKAILKKIAKIASHQDILDFYKRKVSSLKILSNRIK